MMGIRVTAMVMVVMVMMMMCDVIGTTGAGMPGFGDGTTYEVLNRTTGHFHVPASDRLLRYQYIPSVYSAEQYKEAREDDDLYVFFTVTNLVFVDVADPDAQATLQISFPIAENTVAPGATFLQKQDSPIPPTIVLNTSLTEATYPQGAWQGTASFTANPVAGFLNCSVSLDLVRITPSPPSPSPSPSPLSTTTIIIILASVGSVLLISSTIALILYCRSRPSYEVIP